MQQKDSIRSRASRRRTQSLFRKSASRKLKADSEVMDIARRKKRADKVKRKEKKAQERSAAEWAVRAKIANEHGVNPKRVRLTGDKGEYVIK